VKIFFVFVYDGKRVQICIKPWSRYAR